MDLFKAFVTRNLKAFKEAVELGGQSVDTKDEDGYTPLMLSYIGRRMEWFQYILSLKPDLEYEGPDGTILEMVYEAEDLDYLRPLVAAGANLNKQYARGATRLHQLAYEINNQQTKSLHRFEFLKEMLLAMLRPGMDTDLKDVTGRTVVDILFQGGYFDLVREVLYNAGTSTRDPTFRFASDTSDTKYIFAQRGASCGPDAYFTFLLFSDATREHLRRQIPEILEGDAVLNTFTHKDLLARGFDSAILRYVALRERRAQALREHPDRIKRLPSPTLKCEDYEMKVGIMNKERIGKDEGIESDDIIRSSEVILGENKYEIFPRSNFLEFFKFDLEEPATLDALRGMDIRRIAGFYIGLEPILSSREIDAAVRLGAGILSGHAIAFFKYKDRWVLSDDTTGLLHIFRDQAFVNDHLLPTLRDDAPAIRAAFAPIYESLAMSLQVPGFTYPNISPVKKHLSWKYKFGSGVVFLRT
jgi:hypothetical protein